MVLFPHNTTFKTDKILQQAIKKNVYAISQSSGR